MAWLKVSVLLQMYIISDKLVPKYIFSVILLHIIIYSAKVVLYKPYIHTIHTLVYIFMYRPVRPGDHQGAALHQGRVRAFRVSSVALSI